jgi:hypothetical protein
MTNRLFDNCAEAWRIYWWAVITSEYQCQIKIHLAELDFTIWKAPRSLEFSITFDFHFCPKVYLEVPDQVYRLYYGLPEDTGDVDNIPF